METIEDMIDESIQVKSLLSSQKEHIQKAIDAIIECFKAGNKLLICGNGGSAADAQHWAAEFVGRYKLERKGYPAIALTTCTSTMTAWSNDYDYNSLFERQVQSLGKPGDILIGLSTSGNSQNIEKAFLLANQEKIKTISLTGNDGGAIAKVSDIPIIVPSKNTPRIQESHLLIYHIICEVVEKTLENGNLS